MAHFSDVLLSVIFNRGDQLIINLFCNQEMIAYVDRLLLGSGQELGGDNLIRMIRWPDGLLLVVAFNQEIYRLSIFREAK